MKVALRVIIRVDTLWVITSESRSETRRVAIRATVGSGFLGFRCVRL